MRRFPRPSRSFTPLACNLRTAPDALAIACEIALTDPAQAYRIAGRVFRAASGAGDLATARSAHELMLVLA